MHCGTRPPPAHRHRAAQKCRHVKEAEQSCQHWHGHRAQVKLCRQRTTLLFFVVIFVVVVRDGIAIDHIHLGILTILIFVVFAAAVPWVVK
jgi:hypothetical protein